MSSTTIRINVADDGSEANGSAGGNAASFSADGRYIAFRSTASNLVPDDTNGEPDLFVYDRVMDTMEREVIAMDGSGADASEMTLNENGRILLFRSSDADIVPNDTVGSTDLFVHDMVTSSTTRIAQGAPSSFSRISADGRYAIFNTAGHLFIHDRDAGTTVRLTGPLGEDHSLSGRAADISADNRYIVFDVNDPDIVPNDTNNIRDVFVRDLLTGETTMVSLADDGSQQDVSTLTQNAIISADGRYIAFVSGATTLVPNDTNGFEDVFLTQNPFAFPRITTTSRASTTVGLSYSQTLVATSTVAPVTWSVSSSTLPAGLSISSSTGAITGVPTAAGTSTFTVQVTDADSDTDAQELTIVVSPAPAITTTTLPDATVTIAYSQFIGATGGAAPLTWTIASGALPAGLSLSTSTGEIAGTPTANGVATFTVQAQDFNGATTSQALTLRVNKVTIITTNKLPDGRVTTPTENPPLQRRHRS